MKIPGDGEKEYVGVLLVFDDSVKEADVKHGITMLGNFNVRDAMIHQQIEKFDPAWGFPVWYIP